MWDCIPQENDFTISEVCIKIIGQWWILCSFLVCKCSQMKDKTCIICFLWNSARKKCIPSLCFFFKNILPFINMVTIFSLSLSFSYFFFSIFSFWKVCLSPRERWALLVNPEGMQWYETSVDSVRKSNRSSPWTFFNHLRSLWLKV